MRDAFHLSLVALLAAVVAVDSTTLEHRAAHQDIPSLKNLHFIPLPIVNGTGACDMDTGPGGDTLWYRDLGANYMGVYNVKTRKIRVVLLPSDGIIISQPNPDPTAQPCFVRTGADGKIYSGSIHAAGLIQVDPSTNTATLLDGEATNPYQAVAAASGLYVTFPEQKTLTFYPYSNFSDPQPHLPLNVWRGLQLDAQKHVWFTELSESIIGEFFPNNGSANQYPLILPLVPGPMRAFTQNRYLWANLYGVEATLLRIDTTASPPQFTPIGSGGCSATENESDPKGRIWSSCGNNDLVLIYNPHSGLFANVSLPNTQQGFPIPLHYGPRNAMWLANNPTQIAYWKLS